MMSTILIVLGLILLLQSLLALAGGLRFARYAMRSPAKGQRQFQPKAVILVPCKGLDLDFEENLRPLFHQDYREYEIVFITESEADPAHGILSRMIKQNRRAAWLLVAGEVKNRGQKIHNLCAAIEMLNTIDRRTEVKQGGLNSAAIVLRDGRILMCTHQDKRRTGFGAAVFHEVYRRRRALAQQDVHICAWVAASNIDGQRFLIARNMRIIATKAGDGQVCYGPPDRDE